MSTIKQPREIDYLAYLIDECELNSWCKSAFPNMLTYLERSGGRLSEKQSAAVMKAVAFHQLASHVQQGYLYFGYADNKNLGADKPGVKRASEIGYSGNAKAVPDESIDDFDDDIPF